MPSKVFSLWYVFVLLRIMCFVLFCVSWHKWSPSGSRIRRVGLQVLVWFSRWLNQTLLPMSPSHRLSRLWVVTPRFFSIPKSNPMAKSAIGSCSSTHRIHANWRNLISNNVYLYLILDKKFMTKIRKCTHIVPPTPR